MYRVEYVGATRSLSHKAIWSTVMLMVVIVRSGGKSAVVFAVPLRWHLAWVSRNCVMEIAV